MCSWLRLFRAADESKKRSVALLITKQKEDLYSGVEYVLTQNRTEGEGAREKAKSASQELEWCHLDVMIVKRDWSFIPWNLASIFDFFEFKMLPTIDTLMYMARHQKT